MNFDVKTVFTPAQQGNIKRQFQESGRFDHVMRNLDKKVYDPPRYKASIKIYADGMKRC